MLLQGLAAVLVLENKRGCVRKLPLAHGQGDGHSASVRAPVVAAARAGKSLMVLAAGGRIVQRLSAKSLQPLGPPLTLPADVRGNDLLAVPGGWEVLDGHAHRALTLSTDD